MPKVINQGAEDVDIRFLKPHPRNVNVADVGAIHESIDANGFFGRIVVNRRTNHICAGNHRFIAAKQKGFDKLPVEWIDVDTDTELRILLADNRITRLGHDDDNRLAELLAELANTEQGLVGTGFSGDDLDQLISDLAGFDKGGGLLPDADPDEVPEDAPMRCNPGDLWRLGEHRLIVGDCRDADTVARLMDGASINVAVTSPPYAEQREYDGSSGFRPIPPDEYVDWFRPVAAHVAAHLEHDGSWFVNIKTSAEGLDTSLYVFDLVIAHAREWGWHFATEFCWERNGVPKSVTQRFKNQFEPVYQFARGRWKMRPDNVRYHSDNVPTPGGKGVGDTSWANRQGGNGSMFGGAKRRKNGTSDFISDVQGTAHDVGEFIGPGLAYPGNRLPTFAGTHEATGHTAAFPVGLPQFFIDAYTDAGDHVYDPFCGSGSTVMAAENAGRKCFACELSPLYGDIILARYEKLTGKSAELIEHGPPD